MIQSAHEHANIAESILNDPTADGTQLYRAAIHSHLAMYGMQAEMQSAAQRMIAIGEAAHRIETAHLRHGSSEQGVDHSCAADCDCKPVAERG